MGANYSFEVVTPVSRVDRLLSKLAAMVEDQDRERILGALPWNPEIDRDAWDTGGDPARLRCGIRGLARW